MSNLMSRDLYSGFNGKPIRITLIFIFALCLGLNHFVEPKSAINVKCYADTYNFDNSSRLNGGVLLEISTQGKEVELGLSYYLNDKMLASILAHGHMVSLEASTMTYELMMEKARYQHDIFQDDVSDDMLSSIKLAGAVLTESKETPFFIRVLDTDPGLGYSIIQLNSDNGIWACDIKS